jgi:hypothetical protein
MIKVILALIIGVTSAYANKVDIVVNPKEPVAGESFNVTFKVSTKNGTDPLISFDPKGIEVLGRQESGVATRTTYINGKLTVERSISITYEMITARSGSSYLRNILVEVDGTKIKHKTVIIRSLSKARRAKDIMAVAVVDKESAFVGEAILVRYYLYYKTSVSSTDVKKFPKLNKFLKRFHQERLRPERVQVGNDIYTRSIIYTAQLFGEKPGKYKIDPISLSVNYMKRQGGGAFGGFGFGRTMKKSVSSKPISIEIKKLPIDGVPGDFTGLVGKHTFELTLNKNKFLVNEPIEMKLRVKGEGALELYSSPKILVSNKLEEFESTNDFQVSADFTAQKEFNITYLGREEFLSEARKLDFSYFDPESLTYKTASIDLGKVEVVGAGQIAKGGGGKKNNSETSSPETTKVPIVEEKFDLTPVYSLRNTYIYQKRNITYFVALILLCLLGVKAKDQFDQYRFRDLTIIDEIRKKGLTYGKLHELLSLLSGEATMRENVEKSSLGNRSKKDLLLIIDQAEAKYSKGDKSSKLKIKGKVLNEISKILKEKNEA